MTAIKGRDMINVNKLDTNGHYLRHNNSEKQIRLT